VSAATWSATQHRACARAAGCRLRLAGGRLDWNDLYQAAALRILESRHLPEGFAAARGVEQLLRETFTRKERVGVPVDVFAAESRPLWAQDPIGLDEAAITAQLDATRSARTNARKERARAYYRRRMERVRAARPANPRRRLAGLRAAKKRLTTMETSGWT
jgi:hypothetical protein